MFKLVTSVDTIKAENQEARKSSMDDSDEGVQMWWFPKGHFGEEERKMCYWLWFLKIHRSFWLWWVFMWMLLLCFPQMPRAAVLQTPFFATTEQTGWKCFMLSCWQDGRAQGCSCTARLAWCVCKSEVSYIFGWGGLHVNCRRVSMRLLCRFTYSAPGKVK